MGKDEKELIRLIKELLKGKIEFSDFSEMWDECYVESEETFTEESMLDAIKDKLDWTSFEEKNEVNEEDRKYGVISQNEFIQFLNELDYNWE